MRRDDERHGTYAGALAHRKEKKQPCKACREACNAYMREFRSRPEQSVSLKRTRDATNRAIQRLIELHREEYERLRIEELWAIRVQEMKP